MRGGGGGIHSIYKIQQFIYGRWEDEKESLV